MSINNMLDTGLSSVRLLNAVINTPEVAADLISFDVQVNAAGLASGAHIVLITSLPSASYILRSLYINVSGTGFSGGGGNRDISITDGSSQYSLIPAATAETPVNALWGSSDLPFPGFALNSPTASGANLYAVYANGSADYSTGAFFISGVYERIQIGP